MIGETPLGYVRVEKLPLKGEETKELFFLKERKCELGGGSI